jgi:transketolase
MGSSASRNKSASPTSTPREFLTFVFQQKQERIMHSNLLQKAANTARGLAIDAIAGCKSGHLGLPLGSAEIGASLFGQCLNLDPLDPRWLNRDRFVLSAGHGSMFLYAWLHLSGFDLSLDDIRAFRKQDSITPGHPEFAETPGVECTSGPLGQGVGTAVGMALSGKILAAQFNTEQHDLFNYKVICLAGDGCMQEGVALESTEYAGHHGLDNLILIWDANEITLDAPAEVSQSMNVRARYEACGWQVFEVDGHDLAALQSVLETARGVLGKPSLVIAKTEIARGIAQVAGTTKGHGEGGAAHRDEAIAALGLPLEGFHVPADVREAFAKRQDEWVSARSVWNESFEEWSSVNPNDACLLDAMVAARTGSSWLADLPAFAPDKPIATRSAGSIALQAAAKAFPWLLSFSADLYGSNKNYIEGGGDFSADNLLGRNLRMGIREHAMGAVMNGFAYEGLYRPQGGTFMVFADYLRPSIRLAALAGLPTVYYFTHDSIGVGEDGPTHQPIETVSALRLLPNTEVFRPGDAEETAAALAESFKCLDGPTVLALSRQNLPVIQGDDPVLGEMPLEGNTANALARRAGVARGAYVLRSESCSLTTILLATGSEVHLALEAADRLEAKGALGVRVVSVPCMERFEAQSAAYREIVLPPACKQRVAIEAGVSQLWYRYVGLEGSVLAVDDFGFSAPAPEIFEAFGITADALVAAVEALIS